MRSKETKYGLISEGNDRGVGLSVVMRRCVHAVVRFLQQRRALSGSQLEIEDKLTLGPKKSVFVIRCHGQRYLVTSGAETVSSPIPIGVAPARQARRDVAHPGISAFRLNAPGKMRAS